MPFTPSDRWLALMSRRDKQTRAFLVVDACPVVFSTGPIRRRSWDSGSSWNEPGLPMLVGSLSVEGSTGSQIEPSRGKFTISDLSVSVQDLGGEATRWLATEKDGSRVYHRRCWLHVGTADMFEDEYEVLWSGNLEDFSLASGGGAYRLKFFSRLDLLKAEIMTNADQKIDGSVVNGDSSAPRDTFQANGGLSAVDDAYNNWRLKFTRGKNEGDEFTVSDYTGSNRTIVLSSGATDDIKDGDEFALYNYVEIKGNIVNTLVRLLLGDFALSGAIQTDYPITSVVGTPTGLSLTRDDLDETQIQAERDLWLPGTVGVAKWAEKERLLEWAQEQIGELLDARLAVSPEGLVQLRLGRPVAPPAYPAEILEADCEGVPGWGRDERNIVNEVEIWGDWNVATDEYVLLVRMQTADARFSAATIGYTNRRVIKSRWLVTSENGVSIGDASATRLLNRFGSGGPETIDAQGGLRFALLESGERILFTHSKLPSVATGKRGKSGESFEVTKVSQRMDAASQIELTGFYPSGPPAFWGPAAIQGIQYESATAVQRQYAFLSPASGRFADGAPAYTVI